MNLISSMASFWFQRLKDRKEGQDLVEYALVVAMIAFAAAAGMKTIASSINDVFVTVGSTITSASS